MKIALLGDIALFGKMSVTENAHVSDCFSVVADYLKDFDYVVGNLETPFSVEKKHNGAKSAYICSDIDNVVTLRQLHINAVNLANNHMFDYGMEGYEITKRVLKEYKIEYFGAEGKELKIEFEENKIAFSGFCCYSSNPLQCVPYGEYGVNAYNVEQVSKVISQNNKQGFLNIVAVHAGLEHVNYPSVDHIRIARKLAVSVPYVYYGHHPHVIQGVENYNGSLIAHSLGNFCFDDIYTEASATTPLVTLTENNRKGVILALDIKNNKIVSWQEQVIYIGKNGKLSLDNNDESLRIYNDALINCEMQLENYIAKRNEILSDRISERKSMRNLRWYLKRLRPKYMKLIIDGRHNAKMYNANVKKYIGNEL